MYQTLKKNSGLIDLFAIIILALLNLQKNMLVKLAFKTICKTETF